MDAGEPDILSSGKDIELGGKWDALWLQQNLKLGLGLKIDD